MKQLMVLLVALTAFSCAGCATQTTTPATMGKSLLATQQTMLNTHEAFRIPCKKGLVATADCKEIDSLLDQSKTAYDAAVDATILAIKTGKDTSDYTAKKAAFEALVTDMMGLAVKYSIHPTGGSSQ